MHGMKLFTYHLISDAIKCELVINENFMKDRMHVGQLEYFKFQLTTWYNANNLLHDSVFVCHLTKKISYDLVFTLFNLCSKHIL